MSITVHVSTDIFYECSIFKDAHFVRCQSLINQIQTNLSQKILKMKAGASFFFMLNEKNYAVTAF